MDAVLAGERGSLASGARAPEKGDTRRAVIATSAGRCLARRHVRTRQRNGRAARRNGESLANGAESA